MVELIITEKPSACKKIAEALADGKVEKKQNKKVAYYSINHKGKDIIVVCAVGHIYNLAEKDKKAWTYPVFDVEWKASWEISKGAAFSKPYLETIKKLAKGADSFVVATDYDVEGEVIGLNVVRFACKQKDAKRMKFSTLTKDELVKSYDNASKSLNWGQAEAGETRHYLDYFYGINLSRALTLAVKNSGKGFHILSAGRVQGPALKILVDREKEIKSFKPIPYWQIELVAKELKALHEEDKFWEKEKADEIFGKCKGKGAIVDNIIKRKVEQKPPFPFDLTSLQIEAYRALRISPKDTLSLAQELYVNGYISYPRTSSQKLPVSIEYDKIVKDLSEQDSYTKLCEGLISKGLKPNEGKKSDPAHPAIYPTGLVPNVSERGLRLYDLIVRRFLACFGDSAYRESMKVVVDVNGEKFVAEGSRTVEKGWHELYGKYVSVKDVELPDLKKDDKLDVESVDLYDKETQPPKRYTPASIIKELEKRGLGTKATRAAIIENLFDRGYIYGNGSLDASVLGMKTIETLEKYVPEILDEGLTRKFEEEMDKIRDKKLKEEDVLDEAKKVLVKLLKHFKENEKKIGLSLADAVKEAREMASVVGKCSVCGKNNLRIIFSRKNKSYFVACSGYPDCKTTYSVPRNALIKPFDKECSCGFPQVKVIRKGKRPYDFCLNSDCPKKKEWMNKDNEVMVV